MSTTTEPSGLIKPNEPPVGLWTDAWARLRANKIAMVGLAAIALLVLVAIFGPVLTPYDFLTQDLDSRNLAPSMTHWLGTDELGRDVASRVIYGTRTAFLVAIVVTAISAIIGSALGAIAGYAGGKVDATIMWFTDVFMSVPNLLLVIVINTSLKPQLGRWMDQMYLATENVLFRNTLIVDFIMVFGTIALVMWPPYARTVRAQILSVRGQPYVLAARSLGLPSRQIILRYLIPNSIGPLIVTVSAGLGGAMVLESAFSFLGVGVQPPTPSWGLMISDGLRTWQQYPHLLAAPAIALAIASVAFSFIGDGLNDALNPKGAK
jgi:ABC-type dipeptide/oligopeptide/nickel transport system permease subunit